VNISGETGTSYDANSAGTYDVSAVYATAPPQSFSNNTSVNIPDNSCTGASSTIAVSGYSASIPSSGISVQLNITHTWDGDLVIILEAPNGSLLGLSNRVGSSGDNFTNTVFSDAGSAQIPSSGAPYTGTYKPWTSIFTNCVTTTLTTFAGINSGTINPNGNWKLWVYDRANLDFGTIDNWTINFPSSGTGTCTSTSNSVIVTQLNPVSISGFSPATGSPGTPVQINGGDFSGTNAVYFNGVSASFTVNNQSLITAIVPAGALSGSIEVSGDCGSIFSASAFNVISGDVSLNLKVFIEGFYRGSGQMVSVLGSSKCDTIEVSLADPVAPHNLLYTSKGVLDLSGVSNFVFTGAAQKPYYYIVVKHRNSLEVWSGDSVSFVSLNVAYDFTNAADKAYGSVQTDLGGGYFGMYSGDIDQNGVINDADVALMQTGLQSFLYGYHAEDLSGDNHAESADHSLLENNAVNAVTVIKP
jgi:subtilisin-like proprotein convertase family protein